MDRLYCLMSYQAQFWSDSWETGPSAIAPGGAQEAAAKGQAGAAVEAVDQAIQLARAIRKERNTVLRKVTEVWQQSWCPRVPEANGRKILHELDDVKDHPGDRTVDLSSMIEREFLLPFGQWVNQVRVTQRVRQGAQSSRG